MLNKLNLLEEECKSNLKLIIDQLNQNQIKLEELVKLSTEWKEELRTPKIREERIDELIAETKNILKEKSGQYILLIQILLARKILNIFLKKMISLSLLNLKISMFC
jgi:hypothetical protein